MAARMLQRRFFSIFSRNLHLHTTIAQASSLHSFTSTSSAILIKQRCGFHKMGFWTYANNPLDDNSAEFGSDTSPRPGDLTMDFTCRDCETRWIRIFRPDAYEKGVVVARCGGCNKLHVIVDNFGIFDEPGTLEDLQAEFGEKMKKDGLGTLNFTPIEEEEEE